MRALLITLVLWVHELVQCVNHSINVLLDKKKTRIAKKHFMHEENILISPDKFSLIYFSEIALTDTTLPPCHQVECILFL